MELIKFIFSSFWIFVGFLILTGGAVNFVYNLCINYMAHRNIIKYGYPPAHCDSMGDKYDKDED